jgi:hypothetical protein
MKLKVILPGFSESRGAIPSVPLGLRSLIMSLEAEDEIVVTAEHSRAATRWEPADVVVVVVGADSGHPLNLAELYQMAGVHVVLIGPESEMLKASGKPQQTVFIGDAAELWAAFLSDFRRGDAGQCYSAEFTLRDAGFLVRPEYVA